LSGTCAPAAVVSALRSSLLVVSSLESAAVDVYDVFAAISLAALSMNAATGFACDT
jgi:hypothetical protein